MQNAEIHTQALLVLINDRDQLIKITILFGQAEHRLFIPFLLSRLLLNVLSSYLHPSRSFCPL